MGLDARRQMTDGGGRRRIDAAQEDWAFSPAGDALIGGALTDGSVPAR
jgi:hypothetical protein